MGSNAYGESSKESKTEETDINPPKLKKARYLWEVKGNYHLKEGNSSSVCYEIVSEANINPIEDNSSKGSIDNHTTPSNYIFANRNSESVQEQCCVQSFLERSEKFIHSNTGDSSEHSWCHNDINDINFLNWHNKQMVHYDVENKINAALEACLGENLTEIVSFDIDNIVEEVENDIEVKDQGILMAIESCGLKTNDGLNRDIQQDACDVKDKPSQNSVCSSIDSANKSQFQLLDTSESISDKNSQQTEGLGSYEMNTRFWNTAVSAAIYEKGLTYHE